MKAAAHPIVKRQVGSDCATLNKGIAEIPATDCCDKNGIVCNSDNRITEMYSYSTNSQQLSKQSYCLQLLSAFKYRGLDGASDLKLRKHKSRRNLA
jgi:hypothetical protein